ncbi:MAG: 3-5 exonuclease [Tenuifilum sp.]|uniref:3'-5' exonuclease n=1 Tax=Tenuifilum sp. TaxID=2760880 RepID=UPI0024AAED00|nr:3'-5' exonuclease [Tenuifilum sp.]MDI3527763.1 3-5 exonuclease [Tenuifilum sp.]
MLTNVKLDEILFLDIETVPQFAQYDQMPDEFKKLWDRKANSLAKNQEQPHELYDRAGIYAEFGKIICISVGRIVFSNGSTSFRVKSYYGDDEKTLLRDFGKMLETFSTQMPNLNLCAHNGKEFDFPYIARRMLVNGIEIPQILNVAGKKPWEVKFLDTMELWKFGDYKHYTSLNLLAYIFGIKSPKDDIDGSEVATCYYEQNDLPRIVTYCEKDTLTVAQLLLKYNGMPLIADENIIRAGD